MKKFLLYALPLLIFGCSSPKYVYHFDHYDYNSGKKLSAPPHDIEVMEHSPLNPVASTDKDFMVLPEKVEVTQADNKAEAQTKLSALTRAEKKQLKKEVRNELRKAIKSSKNKTVNENYPAAKMEMDNDLKLAIIFGAVGLTLSLFSGISAAFWVLGVIAIVVGVVFLIRWLMRQ